MEETSIKHFYQLLIEKKSELEGLSKASSEARKPVVLDQQSVGRLSRQDALQQQAMAKAQDARRAIDLKRIEVALQKIKDDDFGYCSECGEAIAIKRIEIDPMTELCVNCAGNR